MQVETPSQLHSEFLRATAIPLMVAAMSSRLSDYDYVFRSISLPIGRSHAVKIRA